MVLREGWVRRAAVLVAALAVAPVSAQPADDGQHTHKLLAPGIAASAPLALPLRTVPGRVVLRSLVVGRGVAKDVENASFAVMELEAGVVFTTIAGDRKERVPGDIWTVGRGQPITFENPYPASAAVIRAMYFEPQTAGGPP